MICSVGGRDGMTSGGESGLSEAVTCVTQVTVKGSEL